MIFTSFEFVLFFVVVVGIRACIRDFSTEKWFLLAVSYMFYMSWSVPCGLLILATSIIDYFVGVGLGKIEDPGKRKMLLVSSIVANLGVLGFFKYTNFVLDNLWTGALALGYRGERWHYDIILPAGISFFTFQSITYTIETYRRNLQPCHSFRDFLLFVAFFPQLLAGPINRAADLLPQFVTKVRARMLDFETGLCQFGVGAVKKLVISDQVAPNVDMIFASPESYNGLTLLQGILGYAVQIYCDFSGYSDMAIGCARMMGFRFMENFQMPYSATSITEFWRRWHISLSSWFRDYLYIPLGGNRGGPAKVYFNLLLTMFLCGLWHGASWNFIFWGVFHGVCLAIHRGWSRWDPFKQLNESRVFALLWSLAARGLTIAVVLIGWIFFRATTWTSACEYTTRLLSWTTGGVELVQPYILPGLAAVVLAHLCVHKDRNWAHEIPTKSVGVRLAAYTGILVLLSLFAAVDAAPFIYFQF